MQLMERMKIPVQVHPIIREYLIDTTGSDTIVPQKHDLIWATMKQYLETIPDQSTNTICPEKTIYIELLDCRNTPVFCVQKSAFIHVNTLFRWHLSEKGQAKVNHILRVNFKNQMHAFIQGAMACNPALQQRQAMQQFCDMHKLTMQKITSDMIKKSWDRSEHKLRLNNPKALVNTIIF